MYDLISVAIVDSIGLDYNGDTVFERGLGGSESAVTFMARELAALGLDVTVFCNIDPEEEDVYDNVIYKNVLSWGTFSESNFDVIISSRSVKPLIPNPNSRFALDRAKLKILWMHDTFCEGDQDIERMVLDGQIDEIFTLSDFHTNYVTTCDHGGKRMFEVLKKHIWQTRNGVHPWEVKPAKRDPNLFVYNASITKGMRPLLFNIWPRIKEHLPDARLAIIGGYYKWQNDHKDAYESEFNELINSKDWNAEGVEFTGIISQKEIAELLSKANLFLYPSAFPETFGISTLEALYYGVPLVTCRFGALEETALDIACYKLDYPIEPNPLFPNINRQQQEDAFVDLVLKAVNDTYLLGLKRNACSVVHGLVEWDKVALEWMYHFRKKLGMYTYSNVYRTVLKQQSDVKRVFGRTWVNPDINLSYGSNRESKIVVISPVWNAEMYIGNCIKSVQAQNYERYIHVIIDDCSTDNTPAEISLCKHSRLMVYTNEERKGALRNIYETIEYFIEHDVIEEDSIIVLLDGDDWLVNDPEIFNRYNEMYANGVGVDFTYGSCISLADNVPLIAQEYPEEVKKTKTFREHKFPWNIPYPHLRTFNKETFEKIRRSALTDPNTFEFYKAGGDVALFYELIENATVTRAVKEIVMVYNDENALNDYKVNSQEQTTTATRIIESESKKVPPMKKQILIAIPTAKYIEPETFKSIYDLIIPTGYETTFQTFYGYNVEQVRNLIADWVVKGYDYLFSVDSDITFPPHTLAQLLSHDKDVVSAVYRQRKEEHVLELWHKNGKNITKEELNKVTTPLLEIGGCGFGCVLVKKEVFGVIGYPQFKYHSAIDHKNTISEDAYFCNKARENGFLIHVDPKLLCGHIGSTTFNPEIKQSSSLEDYLRDIRNQKLLPIPHKQYLEELYHDDVNPKVIYDIGASVLHWTDVAREVWPLARIVAFDATEECKFLYEEEGMLYHIGVLSDSKKEVKFYNNPRAVGGNSYYRENPKWSNKADEYYSEEFSEVRITETLDDVVYKRKFPYPDLIKMDVQGSELDILKGGERILRFTKHLILEIPNVDYNIGAPKKEEILNWLYERGFCVEREGFSDNGPDADWHFINTRLK